MKTVEKKLKTYYEIIDEVRNELNLLYVSNGTNRKIDINVIMVDDKLQKCIGDLTQVLNDIKTFVEVE